MQRRHVPFHPPQQEGFISSRKDEGLDCPLHRHSKQPSPTGGERTDLMCTIGPPRHEIGQLELTKRLTLILSHARATKNRLRRVKRARARLLPHEPTAWQKGCRWRHCCCRCCRWRRNGCRRCRGTSGSCFRILDLFPLPFSFPLPPHTQTHTLLHWIIHACTSTQCDLRMNKETPC